MGVVTQPLSAVQNAIDAIQSLKDFKKLVDTSEQYSKGIQMSLAEDALLKNKD